MAKIETASGIDWMACELSRAFPARYRDGLSCAARVFCRMPLLIATTLGRLWKSCARGFLRCPAD